jgi:gliding motility-associated lipoprotein GldD
MIRETGTNKLLAIGILLIFMVGCRHTSAPKPKGYFRIDFPKKEYKIFNGDIPGTGHLPVSFEFPAYGTIMTTNEKFVDPGWFNIDFPGHKARIYFTYRNIKNDLDTLMDESYKMDVKNHITKADAINENMINNPENKVYGIMYDLKGSTATAVQFFATDSTKHFFRGSLYFDAEPNPDSLAPSIDFFREDIMHLIETLKWDKQ